MNGKRTTPSSPSSKASSPVQQKTTKKVNNNSTPEKQQDCEKIDEEKLEIITHGTDDWCGARQECRNHTTAATNEYKCVVCNYSVHSTCFIVDKKERKCLWCFEMCENEEEEKVFNKTVTSSEYDSDYQSDPVLINHNKTLTNEETEIVFDKDQEADHINAHFPQDTSVILPSGSFDDINSSMDISREDIINHTHTQNWDNLLLNIQNVEPRYINDDLIQAMANIQSREIEVTTIDNTKACQYIDSIKTWLRVPTNESLAIEGNRYKIMAKFLEIPIKKKQKLGKDKLNKLKKDIVQAFITRPIALMQKQNLQQLSKITGIFFLKETISAAGKKKSSNRSFIKQKVHL
jgi:hypothetical protein